MPLHRSGLSAFSRVGPSDAAEVADLYFGVIRYQGDSVILHFDPAEIPENRAGVIASLKKHGFTETDIERVAMESSVDALNDLENLALKHELRRGAILCELERRRERRARQQLSPAARQLDGVSASPAEVLPDASSLPVTEPSP
jgi:hypothetical protein